MLTQLSIQNFKGWKDTGSIQMSPITLFFGANSAGKSSIGQFLMLLKQTTESSDRDAVFYPGGKNSAVQLGSYQEMIFQHDLSNKLSFEYQWLMNKKLIVKDPVSSNEYVANKLDFSAVICAGDAKNQLPQVEKIQYQLLNDDDLSMTIQLERKENKKEYSVNSQKYELRQKKMRSWPIKKTVRFYGFPDEMVVYYQNAEFVQQLNLAQENLFKSLYYLGPLRTKTDRLYTWTGNTPESVGYAGENTIAAILASRQRKIGIVKPGASRSSPAKPFEQIIAESLKRLGLIEAFKVKSLSENYYEVKLKTRGSRDWVDLPDVGFGISQVLPVLVQSYYAPPGSIIIMEQPEIHLHPRAQSALADVMIDAINSKENNKDRNIQLIIETHSEHFLRRLQRRIAEEKISREKVSAYFANITHTPAKLEPLQIDLFGNITNWPANFFGDEMADITAQAKAAMEKKLQLKKQSETAE